MITARRPSSSSMNSTDLESSAPPSIEEGAPVDAATGSETERGCPDAETRPEAAAFCEGTEAAVHRLSTFSKKYDIDGDGRLNDAERAVRDMDTSRRGYLTNDKVYAMMQEHMNTHKKLFRTRRIMFFLLALTFILALANLGTSFAAAHLAKDTAANEENEFVHKGTGEQMSAQATEEEIEIETAQDDGNGRRRLCTTNEDGTSTCEGGAERYMILSRRLCKKMQKRCRRGNRLSASYTWPSGQRSRHALCPYRGGTISVYHKSTLRNPEGRSFYFDPNPDGTCAIGGDVFLQDADEPCFNHGHCKAGLRCVKDPAVVSGCQAPCWRKRWAPQLAQKCSEECDWPTCQAIADPE